MKRWLIILGILVLVAAVLGVFFFPRGGEPPDISSGVAKRQTCGFKTLQMPFVTFLPTGKRYRLRGDNGCEFTLVVNSVGNSTAQIRIEKTILRSEEYSILTGGVKYIQEGFYLTLVGTTASGARVAITNDSRFDVSDYFGYLRKCIQNPLCQLVCEDLNGVYSEKECLSGTTPLSKTSLVRRFVPSEKECCLSGLNESIIVPSKSVYYKPEHFKLYFLGSVPIAKCDLNLISPGGKPRNQNVRDCVSFEQIASFKILENMGEEYGNWKAVLKIGDEEIAVPFTYENVAVQTATFSMDFNSSRALDFLGSAYDIRHISGCGGGVILNITRDGILEKVKGIVGDSFPIAGDVNLIVSGASCAAGVVVITLMRAAHPECPNGFCEAGETGSKCPWDCVNSPAHDEPVLESSTQCSAGCYYSGKCLAEESAITIQGGQYQCNQKKLIKV